MQVKSSEQKKYTDAGNILTSLYRSLDLKFTVITPKRDYISLEHVKINLLPCILQQ